MHRSTVSVDLEYDVGAPTHFCFNVEAAFWPSQAITRERLAVSSGAQVRSFSDPANGNRFIRFDAPPGPLLLEYEADVELEAPQVPEDLPEDPVSRIPDQVLHYLMPTRYCESDVMSRAACQIFGNAEPGLARVRRVVDWIHESIEYLPGSTNSTTTAQDVFVQRAGVCRDFAHLGITLCRALNIPARLVVGYVYFEEPPQDFHAVFEAWLGGRWVLFDPTRMAPVDRLVRIGTGRDAKDVAFSTVFGALAMTRKSVRVLEHDSRAAQEAAVAAGELATTA